MVRSVMAVLALIIFPGLMAGQEPILQAPARATLEEVVGRLRVVLTEEETSSAEIVTLEAPVFQIGTAIYLDRKMRWAPSHPLMGFR